MARAAGHRYLILRRAVQLSILLLFAAGNAYGWRVLQGNLSTSRFLGAVTLADPYALLQILFAGAFVPATAIAGGAIVLAFFGAAGGRTFCAWVCPVNMVTDLAETMRRPLGMDRAASAATPSRNARYWVLGIGLLLSAALGVAAFEWVSPIAMLHRGLIYGMGTGWTLVAAVFLFDLTVVRQGFCGHLCPLGAFYALVGRYGLVRIRHREDRCSRCGRCVERCPEPQVLPMVGKRSGYVVSGECTNCGKCIDLCPDDAMTFGVRSGRASLSEGKGG